MITKLGDMIKQKRISLGYSQIELARKCSVSPAIICDIENNKKIPVKGKSIENIAKVLKLDLRLMRKTAKSQKIRNKALEFVKEFGEFIKSYQKGFTEHD